MTFTVIVTVTVTNPSGRRDIIKFGIINEFEFGDMLTVTAASPLSSETKLVASEQFGIKYRINLAQILTSSKVGPTDLLYPKPHSLKISKSLRRSREVLETVSAQGEQSEPDSTAGQL